MQKIIQFLKKPENLFSSCIAVFSIMISQFIQRLYPIIDNRYINILGKNALYIHNLQYNFIIFGQLIGLATYISVLVFWKRKECAGKQGSIFITHIFLSIFLPFCIGILAFIFLDNFLKLYKVDLMYFNIAKSYMKIGLLNMILQALYCGIDGMLIASKKQKISMLITLLFFVGKFFFDKFSVYYLYKKYHSLNNSMYTIGLSTTFLMFITIIIGIKFLKENIDGWELYPLKKIFRVWWSEVGVYIIRGTVPFIFSFQFCYIQSSTQFLVTYQIVLQLAYLLCLPILGSLQIAITEAAEIYSKNKNSISWWPNFFYTGFLPSSFLLLFGIILSNFLLKLIFDFSTPFDQLQYPAIYLFASWIGQIGNALTIPLRATKNNFLVAKNFLLAEFVILIGGTQLLIFFHRAVPNNIGYITILFTIVNAFLNLKDVKRLKKVNYE